MADNTNPYDVLKENAQLRRMLCVLYAGNLAYTDDGELEDNRVYPWIDFKRDTPQEIQDKMLERSLKGSGKAHATDAFPPTPKGSLAERGCVLGDGHPDFPLSATSFRERLFYQLGVADERARVEGQPYEADTPLPLLKPGRYHHYKGAPYTVLGVARHSETLQPLVMYQSVNSPGIWWVRPYETFVGSTDDGSGKRVRRFTPDKEA